MKKLQLFIDFDEVMVNSIDSVLLILNKRYSANYSYRDCRRWDFTDLFSEITKEEITECFESDEFWEALTFKDSLLNFLNELRVFYNIVIVSRGTKLNLEKKEKWLKEHLDVPYKFVPVRENESKGIIDMDGGVQIDDNQFNLAETNATYKILFWGGDCFTDWNDRWDGVVMDSFSNETILNALTSIVLLQDGYLQDEPFSEKKM